MAGHLIIQGCRDNQIHNPGTFIFLAAIDDRNYP